MRQRREAGVWHEAAAVAIVFALGAALALSRAFALFDPFDTSGFLDLFYRISSGQKLYADFFYNAGPVHPYIGALFYKVLGPGRAAVTGMVCALTLFISVGSYGFAREAFGRTASMALATLATLYFVGPVSFPVYDHHAWVFLLSALALTRLKLSGKAVSAVGLRGAACGVLLALSFLTKANIGAAGALVAAAALWLGPRRGIALAGMAAGFFFLVNLVFLALGTPFEFIHTNFVEYAPASRLADWSRLLSVLHDSPHVGVAAGAAVLALTGGRAYLRTRRLDFTILAGLVLVSLFSAWTASMNLELNHFALGVELVLLMMLAWQMTQGAAGSAQWRAARSVRVILVVFAVGAFVTGLERAERWGFFKDRLPPAEGNDYAIKSPPLTGWSCRPRYCEGMDETVAYMAEHVPRGDSLFVFPDMQIIYQLTGHESYHPAPYEFVLDRIPAPGAPAIAFLNAFDANPPKWIVIHDISFLPHFDLDTRLQLKSLYLDAYLRKNYVEVRTGKSFTLLKRRSKEAP